MENFNHEKGFSFPDADECAISETWIKSWKSANDKNLYTSVRWWDFINASVVIELIYNYKKQYDPV